MQTQNEANMIVTQKADIKNRTIYLFGEIDDAMSFDFCTVFNYLDKAKGPIKIILSSSGGEEYAGFAIYDTIRRAKNKVTIVGTGCVQSMAVVVLQAATYRHITPECRLMVHDGIMALSNQETDARTFRALAYESERQAKRYIDIIAERTGSSQKAVAVWVADELYFSAEEALELGLVDKVA